MRRREFLTVSAASATVAATGATLLWKRRERQFSRSTFVAWLGQQFNVTQGAMPAASATLVAVEDSSARHTGVEQFSVLFQSATALPTGACWLAHADGTQFPLYLDESAGSDPGSLRRATFSLLEKRNV